MADVRLFPIAASAQASRTDHLLWLLTTFSAVIAGLVVTLIVVFGVRYRHNAVVNRGTLPLPLRHEIELGWTLTIGFLAIIIFLWSSVQMATGLKPPAQAMQIHVLAKQWMWKVDHPEGAREINSVHVPRGRPVMLQLESRDVIHSFFVPALRIKQDVVPGRTLRLWFTANKSGTFKLLCAEFCGTGHSMMTGQIVVMEPDDFTAWLTAHPADSDLASRGRSLFTRVGCAGCHLSGGKRAPDLADIYGRKVLLTDGRTVQADERYLRDSILRPKSEIVAGYEPIMPSFASILDDEQTTAVVAYLKSLSAQDDSRKTDAAK